MKTKFGEVNFDEEGNIKYDKPNIEYTETKSENYNLNSILPIVKWTGLGIIIIGLIIFSYNGKPAKIQDLVNTAGKLGELKEINITDSGSYINAKFKIKTK